MAPSYWPWWAGALALAAVTLGFLAVVHPRDFRLLLTFAGAVAVSMLGAKLLESRTSATPKPLNPGTVLGGALFGVGWALTGACPAVVLVQLGEGRLVALATLTGIVVGCWVYPKVHARCFPWDAGSCDG